MAAAVPFVPVIASVIGAGASLLAKKPKAPKPVYAQPAATPRANSAVANALMSRRGSLENRRTGAGGVESSTGKKTALGS